jgi:hypothetical protein
MTTITCKIPVNLDAKLEALARRERVSKSTIVRQAIEQRLRRAGNTAAPRAYDLIKHLCGSLRGPTDLSTSPRHMESFGA